MYSRRRGYRAQNRTVWSIVPMIWEILFRGQSTVRRSGEEPPVGTDCGEINLART